ncbi:hypothetical protein IMSHALPRED_001612 [Imshaugia aleurites]|uniref:RapZ C-terminal domain-containing protein n=1 Tax=Imshaugia aleurites TaxID=172621 RepID=A0A8H3J373_9LECA|nr:hypothetical protein IMSHALPRED_001612 [Imshaugia aleurites]
MASKDLPVDLPVARFSIGHRHSNETRSSPCVHFITFGSAYERPQVRHSPVVLEVDLSNLEPPSDHLLERFNGLDEEIVESFFSKERNEAKFHRTFQKLKHEIKGRGRGCVTVLINCTAGRHRSVAMAERLATELRWHGFNAECLHLDILKANNIQAENEASGGAAEKSANTQERERRRSRHRAEVIWQRRIPEWILEGAAAAADKELHWREASLRKRTVSRRTSIPVGEPHTQQRKTAGESVGRRVKFEDRDRGLSS